MCCTRSRSSTPVRRRAWPGRDPQALRIVQLGIAKSTLTHHFRVLREAGVIDQREERRRV